MIHEVSVRSAAGPGGTNAWAVCTCDWWGRTRFTRAEASTDAAAHLKECLKHAIESDLK